MIECKDNIEFMSTIKCGSIDLIYSDILFGTGNDFGEYVDLKNDRQQVEQFYYPRIREMRRILKHTGSIYIHCDTTINHWIRCLMDDIFGVENFKNEIIWCYTIGGKSKRTFGKKHDIIFFYTKSNDDIHTFNQKGASIPRKPNSHMKVGINEDGRHYQEKTDRKSGKVYRYYLDEGKIAEDYWTDIETLNREDKERLGYPTQKPEALLERIIRTSTNEGDIVGDFFLGSGTTAAVAKRLNRRFIGCDISIRSIEITKKRLRSNY